MSAQRRVTSTRPAARNEESGAVCGAWAPRAGSVTDEPSALVLLGRDDEEAGRAVSVREYDFDSDTLLDTVRTLGVGFPTRIWSFAIRLNSPRYLVIAVVGCGQELVIDFEAMLWK